MFYGNIILGKKGPLAKLWLAAHWEKKLSKAHVFETDVPSAVDNLISPSVKIALRTSGHLLLGVVRIYSRKTKYLLADCSEAFVKIKMAFRPGLVDLPEDNREAAASAITLPEFQEWDAIVNDLSTFDLHAQITLNQSRVEEITMKEDLFGSNFILDDNFFGDTPFGEVNEKELLRDASTLAEADFRESDASKVSIIEDEGEIKSRDEAVAVKEAQLDIHDPLQEEGFGMGEGLDFLEELMEGDNVTDPTLEPLDINISGAGAENGLDAPADQVGKEGLEDMEETVAEAPVDQTTLIMNQEEAFSLEPIEESAAGKRKPKRRKRKLVVDDEKILKGDQIRAQLEDTSDIVVAASVAPPTKLRMRLMETSTVKYLFSMPSVEVFCEKLLSSYTRHLTAAAVEDFEEVDQPEQMELDTPELEAIEPVDQGSNEAYVQECDAETPELIDNNQVPEAENISTVDNLFVDVTQGLVDERDDEDVEQVDNLAVADQTKEDRFEENDDLIDEKDDDAQERRWTKRTHQMLNILEREFKKKDKVRLSSLIRKKDSKKQAACLFSTVLILRKEKGILTEQPNPFEDIVITKGSRFEELL